MDKEAVGYSLLAQGELKSVRLALTVVAPPGLGPSPLDTCATEVVSLSLARLRRGVAVMHYAHHRCTPIDLGPVGFSLAGAGLCCFVPG